MLANFGEREVGGEGDRHTIIRTRSSPSFTELIYHSFTRFSLVGRMLLLAIVRHNPVQMLGHVLGHATREAW